MAIKIVNKSLNLILLPEGIKCNAVAGEKGKHAHIPLVFPVISLSSLYFFSYFCPGISLLCTINFPLTVYIPEQNLSSRIKITMWLYSISK